MRVELLARTIEASFGGYQLAEAPESKVQEIGLTMLK